MGHRPNNNQKVGKTLAFMLCLACRLLNAWDYAARFVVSTKYRFDEDSAVDEFSERGRLLLRHEQVNVLSPVSSSGATFMIAALLQMPEEASASNVHQSCYFLFLSRPRFCCVVDPKRGAH